MDTSHEPTEVLPVRDIQAALQHADAPEKSDASSTRQLAREDIAQAQEGQEAQQPQQPQQADDTSLPSGVSREVLNAALTNPKKDLESLALLERSLAAFRYATSEIDSLGMSIDPKGASNARAEVMATFEELRRNLLLSDDTKHLLERLSLPSALVDEQTAAQIRILTRDRASIERIPDDLAKDFQRLTCEADTVWHEAKEQNSWELFAPYLARIVEMMKDIAHEKAPEKDPYDVWLNEFEPDLSQAVLDPMFKEIAACVSPLIAEITQKSANTFMPRADVFHNKFDEGRQWQLSRDLLELEGLDNSHVLLVPTEHPYSDAPSCAWGIIASHVYEHDILSGVYSIFHEGGHTLYELGVNAAYDQTSLKGGCSFGMHEAQSRFFENYIARDRAFIPHILVCMAKHFPGQIGRVTANQLWYVANTVDPHTTRMDADELTYPLHIMIRYEMEKKLFSGALDIADVPEAWNAETKRLLGVDVPSAREGCLQDMHWSSGYIGYFPSYAVGNVIAAQLRHQIIADGIAWDEVLASGDLSPILGWLREHIWQYGRSKTTSELMQACCKEDLNVSYYVDYLQTKFRNLYTIS